MIHISTLRKTLNSKKEFNCKVWTSKGEILICNKVVCTSNYHKGTANLLFTESREVRKVRVICIFELNDEEIYI